VKNFVHLVKRFASSVSPRDVSEDELNMVRSTLSASEYELWLQFTRADRHHSVLVAMRFIALRPNASRNEIAGVLLHDIGKIRSDLSTLQRVAATIVGPRTKRFALYHQHEEIGADMLRQVDSHHEVIAIVNQTCNEDVAAAFRAADNI
jgi:putative nucleotidyltransferase with HDIG domain